MIIIFSIRKNVFETNSSSTHSMAIPISKISYPNKIRFYIGEYGWDMKSVDPASYFYTAIAEISNSFEEFLNYKNKLIEICKKYNIDTDFQEPCFKCNSDCSYFYLDNGYIDHGNELVSFIEMLFNNEELLLNFICGGEVYTGNDNDDESIYYISRNKEFIYDRLKKEKNPYYEENSKNYNWYYKGN